MTDLERFEAELVELVLETGVDEHVHQAGEHVAARLLEFIQLMKDCHEYDRDVELGLAPERLEPLSPATGATSARRRTVHIEQREIKHEIKHEPLLIGPHPFKRGDFTSDDAPLCARCGFTQNHVRAGEYLHTQTGTITGRIPCACGWGDGTEHDRREHEPAGTPPGDSPTPETLTPLED